VPTFRSNPYGAFNYIVSLGGQQGDGGEGSIIGGFSDVSGLGLEVNYSEYRNGNDKVNTRYPRLTRNTATSACRLG
jgi:hypothetical protein